MAELLPPVVERLEELFGGHAVLLIQKADRKTCSCCDQTGEQGGHAGEKQNEQEKNGDEQIGSFQHAAQLGKILLSLSVDIIPQTFEVDHGKEREIVQNRNDRTLGCDLAVGYAEIFRKQECRSAP